MNPYQWLRDRVLPRYLGWFDKRKHYYFDRVCKFLPPTNKKTKHQHDRNICRRDRYLPIKNRCRGDVGALV